MLSSLPSRGRSITKPVSTLGITPQTFCWKTLKNAAGILNHSNPKAAPSLCFTKCAQVGHPVLADSRCILYLYHQQLFVKYFMNGEKSQRPDFLFCLFFCWFVWRGIVRFYLLLLTLESKYDQYLRVSGFHWNWKGDLGPGCLLFPLELNLQKQKYQSSQDYF